MRHHQLDLFWDYLPDRLIAEGCSGQLAFEVFCAANGFDPTSDSNETIKARCLIQRKLQR